MKKAVDFALGSDALGYYRLLEVSPQAPFSEIKRRYRGLAKLWHPDHCAAPDAMEVFQQLSAAYQVLQDETTRLDYDILSLAYAAADFPDMEIIEPCGTEKDNPSVRRCGNINLRGMLWKYRSTYLQPVCTYPQALRLTFKTSLLNWLLGWWSPQALLKNPSVLLYNFKNVDNPAANLRLLVHNAVAWRRAGKARLALQSAIQALDYAPPQAQALLQKFIASLGVKAPAPQQWNFHWLKAVQLVVPAILLIMVLMPSSLPYVSEFDLMKWFSDRKEITYYQEVNFGNRGRTVDDVVVGKILNIPVDRSDLNQLYHLNGDTKLMYGPGDDFDVLKTMIRNTTVRLTGLSPDNIWARVMIDNGETGYLRRTFLDKGIGAPLPEFSKVYQPD